MIRVAFQNRLIKKEYEVLHSKITLMCIQLDQLTIEASKTTLEMLGNYFPKYQLM